LILCAFFGARFALLLKQQCIAHGSTHLLNQLS
jgi:hypothetical protein